VLKLIAGNTKYDGKQNEGLVEFTNFIKSRSGKENAPHQMDIHHENEIFQPPVFHLNIPGKP